MATKEEIPLPEPHDAGEYQDQTDVHIEPHRGPAVEEQFRDQQEIIRIKYDTQSHRHDTPVDGCLPVHDFMAAYKSVRKTEKYHQYQDVEQRFQNIIPVHG